MSAGLVVGVTGLPCAGKSYAARLIAAGEVRGLPGGMLLKADDVGHEILVRPEVVERLRARFGSDAFADADPAAVRRRIAERVFANPDELRWLESVVHPLVTAELDRVIASSPQGATVVAEAALLGAGGMDRQCDVIVVVEAAFEVRLTRAAARGWDRKELERRDARLRELFEPARLEPDKDKLVFVRNDSDDGRLAARIETALVHSQ